MHGPDITWYVVLAGILFVIGALGVLVRRSPLIILLSIEIMLNGVEPRADRVRAPRRPRGRAGVRDRGHGDRRLGGRRRPRAHRRDGPPHTSSSTSTSCGRCADEDHRRRRLGLPARPARRRRPRSRSPATRLSRRGAGMLSTLSTIAAFAAAAVAFVVMLERAGRRRPRARRPPHGPGSRPAATTSGSRS